MIVVDTTVLVYAVGGEHPLREPCARLIEAIGRGIAAATTTVEVVQEFVNARSRRRSRKDAVILGRDFAALLSPLLVVDRPELERGLSLFERHDGLRSFDAVLAAAALEVGAEALVSSDAGFRDVPRLPYVGIGTAEFDRLFRLR